MSKISVCILAYNEEAKIKPAIESVKWADEIVVVDSYSTDNTRSMSEGLGAKVVDVSFKGFGKLRNEAISACKYEWIFSLDADERCTDKAASEIRMIIRSHDPYDAYYVPRQNWFMGRLIRYSGWYPDYRQPQLFRRGALKFSEEDEVHEGYQVTGRTGYMKNPIYQIPFRNFEQLLQKANRYSSLGAQKLERRSVKTGMPKALAHGLGAFLNTYFIKLGFMDGWAGFVIALGNFEGTFYRYAKFFEKLSGWDRQPEGLEHKIE